MGLDVGDRSSWYCVLDEAGEVLLEQKVATTPKALKEMFGKMPRSRVALETWIVTIFRERRFGPASANSFSNSSVPVC